jgi:hypothetical protein
MNVTEEDGTAFSELLGAFGSHANLEKRAKAERLAAMKPGDGRRKKGPTRTVQFNVRISEHAKAQADALLKEFGDRDGKSWSQADLIEHALAVLAKQKRG